MKPEDFRRLALSLPGAVEGAHMDKADFRAGGKIFATMGYQQAGWAMVKLDPEESQVVVAAHPGVFVPAAGKWGLGGATTICLKDAKVAPVRAALASAHRRATAKVARPRKKLG